MRRIVYLSASRGMLSEADIHQILNVSWRNNAADGITGMLAYHDGAFFQVVEGPDPAVDTLMARISQDPRHRNLLTLWSGQVTSPSFPEWTMAFLSLTGGVQAGEDGAVSLKDVAIKARSMTDDRRINLLLASFLNNFWDFQSAVDPRWHVGADTGAGVETFGT